MTNRKTGLIGGTFNPVHYGHLFLAEQAMEYCHLDQVLFIPSGISYMKNVREIASAEDRLQMVRLATENFRVSSVETDRPGESYTCETLLALSKEYADTRFYFIIGADNLFSIEKWKEPAEIFRRCTLVAAFRGDEARSALEEKAEDLYHKYQATGEKLYHRTWIVPKGINLKSRERDRGYCERNQSERITERNRKITG